MFSEFNKIRFYFFSAPFLFFLLLCNIDVNAGDEEGRKVNNFGASLVYQSDQYFLGRYNYYFLSSSFKTPISNIPEGYLEHRNLSNQVISRQLIFDSKFAISSVRKNESFSTQNALSLGLYVGDNRNENLEFRQSEFNEGDTVFSSVKQFDFSYSEIGVRSIYTFNANYKRLKFHTGFGIGLGLTINNRITQLSYQEALYQDKVIQDKVISEENKETVYHDARTNFFLKGFIPYGVDIELTKHLDLMLQSSVGFGVRKVFMGREVTINDSKFYRIGLRFFI